MKAKSTIHDENETTDNWAEDDPELTGLAIATILFACGIIMLFASMIREMV